MYTGFYELQREPFHVTPDPEFLFPSPAHKEALAAIIYGIEQRKGFVAITGEVGVGKTTILRSYLDLADRKNLKLIYIYNSDLTFDDLLTTIFQELGIADRPATTFMAVMRLHEELIEIYRRNLTVVVIIDEAQNTPVETLESLRMLSNLETVNDKLIQIILIGQPEFEERLQEHRLRQLRQRIAIHARIEPLTLEGSIAYLEYRLNKVSLSTKPVFTKQALRLIAEAAKGIPRTLNILSDNALITGFGYQVRPINAKIVGEVLADRKLGERPVLSADSGRHATVAAVAAAAVAAAILLSVIALPPLLRSGEARTAETDSGLLASPAAQIKQTASRIWAWIDHRIGAAPFERFVASASLDPESVPAEPQTARQGDASTANRIEPTAPRPLPPPVESRQSPSRKQAAPSPPAPSSPMDVQTRPGPEVADIQTRPEPKIAEAPIQATRSVPAAEPLVGPPDKKVTEAPVDTPPADEPPGGLRGTSPAASGAPSTPPGTSLAAVPLQRPGPRGDATPQPSGPPRPSPEAALTRTDPSTRPAPASAPPTVSRTGPEVPKVPLGADAAPQPTLPPTAAARPSREVRTVRFGDSLWTMAADVYGYASPDVLRRIQDANPHIRNINWLTPGQEIVFPRAPEAVPDASVEFMILPRSTAARRN